MEKLVEQINAQYALFAENAEAQVSKNNKAAGTRARKAALEIMKLMKEFRKASVEAAKFGTCNETIRAVHNRTALIVSLFLFTDYSATDARSRLSTGGSAPRATPAEPRYNSIPRRRK